MRMFLTARWRGQYALTGHWPCIATVDGTDTNDVYVTPGDAVGIRHLCPRVIGLMGFDLKRFETVEVDVRIAPVVRDENEKCALRKTS